MEEQASPKKINLVGCLFLVGTEGYPSLIIMAKERRGSSYDLRWPMSI